MSAKSRDMSRVLQMALNSHWAMEEEALRRLLHIAARGELFPAAFEEQFEPEAVAARIGRPLQNTRTVEVRDGVAAIPLVGPVFRYANFFTRISGATSIEEFATDLTEALESPDVDAIVLNIDSPGGEVNGTQELADMVFGARGQKPIVAYVDFLAASAAYWIASAADEIVAAPTAILGSIGVRTTFIDRTKQLEKAGIEVIDIVSSQTPRKDVDPTTRDGRSDIQAVLDALAQTFIETVARNRGVAVDTVLKEFGRGGVFVGQAAVDAGLADRLGTYEGVVVELASSGEQSAFRPVADGGRPSTAGGLMDDDQKTTPSAGAAQDTAITGEELTVELDPDVAAVLRAEGAAAERERITGILELSRPGEEALVAQMVREADCSVGDAAQRLRAEEAKRGKAQLTALREDEKGTEKPSASKDDAAGDPVASEVAAIVEAHALVSG